MDTFYIKMIDSRIRYYGRKRPYCMGKIKIGDFRESFRMSLVLWDIEKYKLQWKEGIDRIRDEDKSCLVTSVVNVTDKPFVEWWPIYKEGERIFFQNEWLWSEEYKEAMRKNHFNEKTCYSFLSPRIPPGEGESSFSEWSVSLKDFLRRV